MDDLKIESQLLELARLERDSLRQRTALLEQRDALFQTLIAPLDAQIEALDFALVDTEENLKQSVLSYIQETGETRLHPSITFRRTKTLVYDKAQVLAQLEAEGVTELTRVKRELDARAFEKAFRDGQFQFVEAEIVNAPTIALGRLGDLLIAAGEDSI